MEGGELRADGEESRDQWEESRFLISLNSQSVVVASPIFVPRCPVLHTLFFVTPSSYNFIFPVPFLSVSISPSFPSIYIFVFPGRFRFQFQFRFRFPSAYPHVSRLASHSILASRSQDLLF